MRRKVRVKVTFYVDSDYPEDWTDDSILFHLNESSFCMDNLLTMRLEQTKREGHCTCMTAEAVLAVPPEGE